MRTRIASGLFALVWTLALSPIATAQSGGAEWLSGDIRVIDLASDDEAIWLESITDSGTFAGRRGTDAWVWPAGAFPAGRAIGCGGAFDVNLRAVAVLWTCGGGIAAATEHGITPLAVVDPAFQVSDAFINQQGEILVQAWNPSTGVHRSVLRRPGGATADVAAGFTSPEWVIATGMNDNGEIAGHVSYRDAWFRGVTGELSALGTLGGEGAFASALNNEATVVGISVTGAGERHGFVWSPHDGMRDMNIAGPQWDMASLTFVAVNDLGEAIAYVDAPPDGNSSTPLVWSEGEGLRELPGLGAFWNHGMPRDINVFGEIVGSSEDGEGRIHPVIWRLPRTPEQLVAGMQALVRGLQSGRLLRQAEARFLTRVLATVAASMDRGRRAHASAALRMLDRRVSGLLAHDRIPTDAGARLREVTATLLAR